ncbi:hypothetical protein ACJU26_08870 [Acidithiobacillus sp. M4-SHS-6]|uniref:hypothetical protein n=1 Tax=Acidithiobacillus sp. M4-SHS-6 TaxID=3383024 RepID=UPI0039BDAB90
MGDLRIKDIPNAIDAAGSVRQLVENLFYGWGYNAYDTANQFRADDLLIRNALSEFMGQIRATVHQEEMDFRREHLPPPSREHPFPDKAAIATAQELERIQKQIESIELRLRTASVPENDRVWQRHRNETDTLHQLLAADMALGEAVIVLAKTVCDGANSSVIHDGLDFSQIESALTQRESVLSIISINRS